MSICNECWGKGWIEKQGVQFGCRKCKGTGVIENEPQTNEEWFGTLNTKEKAKALRDATWEEWQKQVPLGYQIYNEEFWEKWLQEEHKGN